MKTRRTAEPSRGVVMKRLVLLAAVVLVAATGAVQAYPSLLGPTGSVNLPTAAVNAPEKLNVAVDYYDNGYEGGATDVDAAIPIRLLYGVSQNVEVGATYTIQNGKVAGKSVDLDSWGLNFKYYNPIISGKSGWAIGAVHSEFTDDDLDNNFTQLYWVGSSVLSAGTGTSPKVTGSFGINWTSLESFGADDDAFRPYVVLDFAFPSKLILSMEYQLKDSDVESDALSSIVARYPFSDKVSGQIGFSNGIRGVVGGNDHNFLAGLNVRF